MLEPLIRLQALDSLLFYISKRLILSEELRQLRSDANWVQAKALEPTIETWSLAKVIGHSAPIPPAMGEWPTASLRPKGSPPPQVQNLKVERGPVDIPNPPRTWTRNPDIPYLPMAPVLHILTNLMFLSDSALLDQARSYSFSYDNAIYRWSVLRNALLKEVVPEFSPDHLRDDALIYDHFQKLSVAQADTLIHFYLPNASENDALLKQTEYALPSIGAQVGVTFATTFIEIFLLLLCCYFLIWYREAKLSPNFPARGTIFGALSRSPLSRFMFLVMLLLPAVASILLAARSFPFAVWNSVIASFVVLVVFLIRVEEYRKCHFGNGTSDG